MFNPNLFLLGLPNKVEILGSAHPGKAENTFNYIEIVEEDIQDVVKPVFRQFRGAQIRYFYDSSYTLLVTFS